MMNEYHRFNTACFTGHRAIPAYNTETVAVSVAEALRHAYESGYRAFICGGARGFDTIAALEVIRFRNEHPEVRLIVAVPCLSQADKWNADEKKCYRTVLAEADEVLILSETYYAGCMQSRNRFMVDHSSLCLCYLLRFEGGTWSTVRYALHEGVTVRNLAIKDSAKAVMKENSWNSIFTYHSVQESVSIVRLCHTRPGMNRWKNTSMRFSGKQISGRMNLTRR